MKRYGWALLMVLVLLLGVFPAGAQSGDVLLLEVEGAVTPAMASYFARGVEEGEERGADAVLIVLDTPGGSTDTMQEIVQSFRNAQVPVIVYVGPAGAQAASAGSIITLAAHAAGMAPETVIGAASPVNSSGEDLNETMFRKVTEDLKAQVRGLAARRGEEAVALAEEMIETARAVNANEALAVGLIDAVATDVPGLLAQLDGLDVMVGETPVTLNTAGATLVDYPMNTLESVLHALSNPLLIGILLTLGVQAILIELSHPGGWVAGFVGVLSLGLAFYGLGQLPANWLGLGLILVAFVLLLLEVKTPGTGALAIAGAITLFAGLLVLFNSPGSPEFARISISGAVAIAAVTAGFFLFIVTKAVSAQRKPAITGREGLVGKTGHVRKALVPLPTGKLTFAGSILVNGELWRAHADEAIETDETVVVTGMDGFTLQVQKVSAAE